MASIAPLAAGWQQRLRNPAGPLGISRGTSSEVGVPFLVNELGVSTRLVVEAAWGADLTDVSGATWTWYDISSDVRYADGINITCGKQQENAVAPPASLSLTLDNVTNKYTQYNPLSVNWPYVHEGVPIRTRVIINGTSYLRFQGRAVGFTPAWDTTGNNAVAKLQARGISYIFTKRGKLSSSGYRVTAASSPIAFWPGEDESSATAMSSAVAGGSPMTVINGTATFGDSGTPGGWSGSVGATSGPRLQGKVTASTGTKWTIDTWVKLSSTTGNQNLTLWSIETPGGSVIRWEMALIGSLHALQVKGYTDATTLSSSSSGTPGSSPGVFDDAWHLITVVAGTNGSGMVSDIYLDGVKVDTTDSAIAGTTSSMPSLVTMGPIESTPTDFTSIGAIAVWNSDTSATVAARYTAGTGQAGEAPATRLARVCSENSVAFVTDDFYSSDVTMGAQPITTFLATVQDAELADAGFLYDGLSAGFRYQGISQRYDQAASFTVDASSGQVVPPFNLLLDDYNRVNKITVNRTNGGSAIYVETNGDLGTTKAGIWEGNLPGTVNYQTDTPLDNRARWEVHKGTVAGYRFVQIPINLRKTFSLATSVAALTPGRSFTLIPPYVNQLPSANIDLVVEGWTERLTQVSWDWTANTSLSEVYNVWKVEDSQLGRYGTDGHTTYADVPSGASTIYLTTPTDTPLWTTDSNDFPMYVLIDGIKVKLTAISGSSSPQTATADGTTITKVLAAGKSVTMWKNGVIKL